MKKNPNSNPLSLTGILEECGLEGSDAITVRTTDGLCLIHEKALTALELANIIAALTELASDMTVALAAACGFCDNCGEENPEHCPDCSDNPVCAELNGCKDTPADWVRHCDLCRSLLKPGIVAILAKSGVCLAELDELIMLEEIVYGK